MERFVIRQNIEHYRAILKITPDPVERRRIENLLREEEGKLKKYDEGHKKELATPIPYQHIWKQVIV